MASKVVFTDVCKTYERELGRKSIPALNGVTFSVAESETVGLIGANGAGKSTCIRLLMDFIRPDSGSVLLGGRSVGDSRLRQNVGYLPEIPSFPANLTIMDLVKFVGGCHSMRKKQLIERADYLLDLLGLWHVRKKPVRNYSKGMQQRAGFVLALLHDPSFLILDEPMSGLDPIGRAQIGELVSQLKQEGKTILFCSHILEDVDRLVDRLLILHHGEKLFEGTVAELSGECGTSSIVSGFLATIGKA